MPLINSVQEYDDGLQKAKTQYSGLMGLAIDGSRKVNIPTRAGYVYVRLRDNLSEVIQAYNDKVSPVYDFPVLIERRGNKWYITGRDDQRYETFGTASPFLPQHGDAHSFNRDGGGGGDTVFVYPDQFVPLLVYPSGTFGAGNLMVAPYALQRDSDFIYVGSTGTGNLLIYKPTDAQAIVGLVYLDKTTGNPGVLIASGTPMNGTSTGTAAILPYLPYPSSNQEPLYAFRLVSGTTSLLWNNLYNVRQFYGGSSSTSTGSSGGGIPGVMVFDEGIFQGTGTAFDFVGDNVSVTMSGATARVFVTGSAGSSLPSFMTGSIPYAGSSGILTESNEALWWDESNRGFRLGKRNPRFEFADTFPIGITAKNQDETISIGMLAYGTGTSGAPSAGVNFYRSRSSLFSQGAVKSGDILGFVAGRGYDGSTHSALSRINFFASGDAVAGTYAPTGIDFLVIPSGSITSRSQFTVYGNSVNLPTGSTYNIGGSPHTHFASDTITGTFSPHLLGSGTYGNTTVLSGGSLWVERPRGETNTNPIFRVDSPGGDSQFVGTIATLPGGATLTYNVSSGFEGAMVPFSTSNLAKMRLYNTTRGTSALISNCVTGTNTITLTANVPGGWTAGDTITILSQTITNTDFKWVDIEITTSLTGKLTLFVTILIAPSAAGQYVITHPFSGTFSYSQTNQIISQSTNVFGGLNLLSLSSNVFSMAWTGTPAAISINEAGILQ